MSPTFRFSALAAFWATAAFAAPSITGIVNSASLLPPGAPNSAIAQGAIFNIFGTELGPATLISAPLPLPTTLGGTSVSITVGTTTVDAPMFYSVASQVAAILPSNTPIGSGTVTVRFAGASVTSAISVVRSNVGIYTANQSGGGPGVVTFGDYSVPGSTRSAKAGDALIIWATGLGPIATSDSNPPAVVDLATPITVFVGGVAATPFYRGRSGFAGLDQINFFVPQGVPPGCNVSLVIQTGNLVSNNTTIPVTAGGGACSDSNAVFPPSAISLLQSKAVSNLGNFQVQQQTRNETGPNGQNIRTSSTEAEVLAFSVTKANLQQVLNTVAAPSLGSCLVRVTNGAGAGDLINFVTPLSAGSSMLMTPPAGPTVTLASPIGAGQYSATLSSYGGGRYGLSGSGGSAVGAFNVNFTAAPLLTWTNPVAPNAVLDRTQPLTVNWTGGDPNGYVQITVDASILDRVRNTQLLNVQANCQVPTSAGTFQVPPSVLLALPAGTNTTQIAYSGAVAVDGQSNPVPLTVPGMDYFVAQSGTSLVLPVQFR